MTINAFINFKINPPPPPPSTNKSQSCFSLKALYFLNLSSLLANAIFSFTLNSLFLQNRKTFYTLLRLQVQKQHSFFSLKVYNLSQLLDSGIFSFYVKNCFRKIKKAFLICIGTAISNSSIHASVQNSSTCHLF